MSGRKPTCKGFHQATKLMVTKDGEFLGTSTFPPFASPSYPFHMGISLLFQEAAYKDALRHSRVAKTQGFIVRKGYLFVLVSLHVNN